MRKVFYVHKTAGVGNTGVQHIGIYELSFLSNVQQSPIKASIWKSCYAEYLYNVTPHDESKEGSMV